MKVSSLVPTLSIWGANSKVLLWRGLIFSVTLEVVYKLLVPTYCFRNKIKMIL